MKIFNEDQLLSAQFRKQIIKDINSSENQKRKQEAKKRYDLLKDDCKKYVVERLEKELSKSTVDEMIHRASNISIFRKIIEKKSRVYQDGVTRSISPEYQQNLDNLIDATNINVVLKSVNKVLEAQKNCALQIVPYECEISGNMKLKLNVLHPYLYDVIEDFNNPERARCFIFSYWSSEQANEYEGEGLYSGVRSNSPHEYKESDGKDQIIADFDDNKEKKYYVFWSNKYHFTTNEKGEVIQGLQSEDYLNPIGVMPVVFFSLDQDGEFWAKGGSDLVDGSILINLLLTDLYHIAKVQGMGLFYMFGKHIPETIKVGPNTALTMQVQDGDPTPQIGFASSNPPLQQHLDLINSYIKNLLSTNYLDPGDVTGDMTGSASSGIQEMIKRSEVVQIIDDQKELFRDKEYEVFNILNLWINNLFERGVLDESLSECILNEIPSVRFNSSQEFMTEEQKLNIIEKRRNLNLDSELDSLKRDNPDLTQEDAEKKLLEIMEAKLLKQRAILMGVDDGRQGNVQDSTQTQ